MNLKLIAAILLLAAVPGWAQAQSAVTDENAQHETISGDTTQTKAPNAVTNENAQQATSGGDNIQTPTTDENAQQEAVRQHAQQVYETISNDKVQTQAYCDVVKLNDKIKQASLKGDFTSEVELSNEESGLTKKIDPSAAALLIAKFSDKALMAKLGFKPNETLEATIAKLDGLCGSAEQEPGSAEQEPDGQAGSEDRSGNTGSPIK
jgi:hypothetical protein